LSLAKLFPFHLRFSHENSPVSAVFADDGLGSGVVDVEYLGSPVDSKALLHNQVYQLLSKLL